MLIAAFLLLTAGVGILNDRGSARLDGPRQHDGWGDREHNDRIRAGAMRVDQRSPNGPVTAPCSLGRHRFLGGGDIMVAVRPGVAGQSINGKCQLKGVNAWTYETSMVAP